MKRIGVFVLGMMMVMAPMAFSADISADISKMMLTLEKAKAELSGVLTAIDRDLTDLAKKLAAIDQKSAQARKMLSLVCAGRPYVYDCAIVDMQGKLSVIEPEEARKYEGEEIGFKPQVKELFKTKAPLVSKVFTGVDGKSYVDFEYPIITDKGEFLGAVSLLVRHDQLLGGIIVSLVEGRPYKMWVMQIDGLVMYDPDSNQINKNIFSDEMFKPFSDLVSFSRTVAEVPNGAGSYDFYKEGYTDKTLVKKDAVWDTVALHGAEWRLVIMEVERALEIKK